MTLELHKSWNSQVIKPKMHTVLPECEQGELRIDHTVVSNEDAMWSTIGAMRNGRGALRAGETVTRLFRNGLLWMSDTPDERRDHHQAIRMARGECLVGGLGLGYCALAMALKPDVERVDVIEIDQATVDLVLPHLQKHDQGKINVIVADLMEWKPSKGQAWDTIWFDIWPTLCVDDLKEHATLNRRYARRTRHWRGCWGSHYLKRRRAEDRRHGW